MKIFFLALDPLPKIFMGDSGSYLWTAITEWIPEDRSYFYGYLIRWSAVAAQSLTSLLLVQLALSTFTAILVAAICRTNFNLSVRVSYILGFVCALDPLQLLWERYVMTETTSLFLYAAGLYYATSYIRRQRIIDLVLLQVLAVLLIGFRMSFLLLVQINTVLLPLLAFAPAELALFRNLRNRWSWSGLALRLRTMGLHLLISLVVMFTLHSGYKRLNGRLSHREPAYLYVTGLHLLAFWAPALSPVDAPEERVADLIAKGDEYQLREPGARNSQRFGPEFLIDRLTKLEPDPAKADQLAKKTALHALVRDPLKIVMLGLETYAGFWSPSAIQSYAELDFSFTNLPPDEEVKLIATQFHQTVENDPAAQKRTFLQNYYVNAWPYFFLVLLSPLLAAVAVVLCIERRTAVLVFVHASMMLAVSVMLAPQPVVRYLHPISLLTILALGLCWRAIADRRIGHRRAAGLVVTAPA